MDKRALAKIKPAEATDQTIALAGCGVKYVIHGERHEDLFCLYFFEAGELEKGKRNPRLRTFFDVDDYITQDLSSSKVKWLTGRIDAITGAGWWCLDSANYRNVQYVVDSEATRIMIDEAFPQDGTGHYWMQRIYKWQSDILQKRLEARHERELAQTNETMKLVPELPAGFDHWAEYEGMKRFNAIPYIYSKKNVVSAYCPVCNTELNLDKRKINIRRGTITNCPACGSEGKLLPISADFNPERWKDHWVAIIQRTCGDYDGFVIRYFGAQLSYAKKYGCWPKRIFGMYEAVRTFYTEDARGAWKEAVFEFAPYKNSGMPRWIPYANKHDADGAVLYTSNLPLELIGTPWQYCSVDRLQMLVGSEEIHLPVFMRFFRNARYFEYLIKAGMSNLVQDLSEYSYGTRKINGDGTTIEEIFGLKKPYMKILRQLNGGYDALVLIQQIQKDGVLPKTEEVKLFIDTFGADKGLMHIIDGYSKQMSITRFVGYITRQANTDRITRKQMDAYGFCGHGKWETVAEAKARAVQDRMSDWTDYVTNAKQLGMDLTDIYYLLPKDLTEAHNHVMHEVEKLQQEKAAAARKKMNAKIRKIMESMTGVAAIDMKTESLMIVLPKDGDDLKHEGSILHHCVGTYADKVAKGLTMILFVRKADHPDVPYFTMEWQNNEIRQLRGKYNCDPPKEVLAFAKAFEKKMREEAEAGCRKNALASTTSQAS